MPLITVENLSKRFNLEAGFFAALGQYVYAVNGVSFEIGENECYGLVGESGCGKTTTARLLVRMYDASSGSIRCHQPVSGSSGRPFPEQAKDIGAFNKKELGLYREKVRYVFQDPARSLNPRMSVFNVLVSGLRHSSRWRGRRDARDRAAAILEEVGLSSTDLERRPAEFSGGQRQRISIARGLLVEPELLICDEVVSALDVSVQGQILNLLLDIRKRRNLSFLFIAHDLKVASYFCDRIGVMYRGELMEEAPAEDLHTAAAHPYTKLLFSSVAGGASEGEKSPRIPFSRRDEPGHTASTGDAPALEESLPRRSVLAGEVRTALSETAGCAFAERCPLADGGCLAEKPPMREIAPGRKVRCFRA
ncbi:MAG: ABC transporter ATP-binding protein [Treponema sp.]|jgi:oligopeptide/dipeptide ABC transporter ATP-binding protein|nr:ABC transporter ATP-binding protein [Treponema sp.]